MSYDPEPRYELSGGAVEVGYEALAMECARTGASVLAIDGPATLPWEVAVDALRAALSGIPLGVDVIDVRRHLVPFAEVAALEDDPAFARLPDATLAGLFDVLPARPVNGAGVDLTLVIGPGSALVPHDVLWYADQPKSVGLARVRRGEAGNLGQPLREPGSERRLLYIDWPLVDRHKQTLSGRLDRFVDLTDVERPRSVAGDAVRASLRALAGRPFRTCPTFLPGPWGGRWLQEQLAVEADAPNLAWSYELITPESGLLLGGGEDSVEVGFELLMAEQGERILGADVAARFGRTFPIRFDYLDTLGGGHLSLQCHPTDAYARETFGLDFTQDETYYVMETTPGATVWLGLQEGADLEAFRREAEQAEREGVELEAGRYLRTQAAERHRLYLIPAGTPHASGAGNVVLEISATPYLYTLRFYDWLRRDLEGELRPVHLDHAFANLDPTCSGARLSELMPEPTVVREGKGWREVELGRHPDLFFAVHRLEFDDTIEDETAGRFHVLNLVEGTTIEIESETGDVHPLSYAETIVVPAAVGRYRLTRSSGPASKVVKAFVR